MSPRPRVSPLRVFLAALSAVAVLPAAAFAEEAAEGTLQLSDKQTFLLPIDEPGNMERDRIPGPYAYVPVEAL